MTEAQYLARLREMWQKNWPQEAPRAPHYPFGERPLTDYLRATYKIPRIRFIDELPLTATGKVKKEELVRLLDDAHNSGV